MRLADTTDKLQSLLGEEIFNYRFSCGYHKPTIQITLGDRDDFIRSVWMHHVMFQPHAELEQLRKGINETLQFQQLLNLHPKEMWILFAATPAFSVTPQYLCDSFVITYSDNGSNRRTKEEAIVMYWNEYIIEHVNVGEVLKFLTGSSRISPMGFENIPTIYFMDDEHFPVVSTCGISITFPRSMGLLQYENFKERMDYCIHNSYGFGSV